jgi:hypothetical protein
MTATPPYRSNYTDPTPMISVASTKITDRCC